MKCVKAGTLYLAWVWHSPADQDGRQKAKRKYVEHRRLCRQCRGEMAEAYEHASKTTMPEFDPEKEY